MTRTEDLIDDIKRWGREHGIDNPTMQFAKINEEVGELAHELTRGRCPGLEHGYASPEAVDAIGDILVTVIIFADIVGVNPIGALKVAYDEIKDRQGKTVDGGFVKDE